jgi:hypothetical protein
MFQYKHYKNVFEKKMLTNYLNTSHMIVQSTLKKVHNPHLTHLQLSQDEFASFQEYINENLDKRFI